MAAIKQNPERSKILERVINETKNKEFHGLDNFYTYQHMKKNRAQNCLPRRVQRGIASLIKKKKSPSSFPS